MKVQAHFLADSANFAADGTFSVFKGGITELNAPSWPVLTRFVVVTRLELTQEEASQLVELTLRIWFGDREVTTTRQPLATKPGDPSKPSYVNSIAELGFQLPGPGRITIEAAINDTGLPLLYLWAQQPGSSPAYQNPSIEGA